MHFLQDGRQTHTSAYVLQPHLCGVLEKAKLQQQKRKTEVGCGQIEPTEQKHEGTRAELQMILSDKDMTLRTIDPHLAEGELFIQFLTTQVIGETEKEHRLTGKSGV